MIYRVTGKCTERIDGTGDFYLRDGSRITGRRVVWTHLRNTIYCWATTTTKKEREGGRGVCVREREREEKGREMTKIEGRREGEKEVVERRRKKDRYLSTVTEERHVLSRCRADADAHAAIHPARYPRIGFQEDGLYEGAIRDILYYGGRGRERGQ